MTTGSQEPRARSYSAIGARIAALIWGGMMVAGLVIGAIGPDSWKAAVLDDGPGCPFKFATGIDCPFCGMTHATVAMGGGHFGSALDYHPLAPVVVLGMLALVAIVAVGRADMLLRGKRPIWLLGGIAAVWILRFVL